LAKANQERVETLATLQQNGQKILAQANDMIERIQQNETLLEQVKKERDETTDKLLENERLLMEVKREKAEAAQKLALADAVISERDKAIRETEALLEKSERILAQANQERTNAADRLLQSEKDLSHTSGQLEMTKHELELLREQARLDRTRADEAFEKYHAAEMELVEARSELTSTQSQLNGMVHVLTDVNNEFAKAKSESVQYRQSLAATEEKLIASQEMIGQTERLIEEKDKQIAEKHQDLVESRKEADELKRQLTNDVLNSYNASALELSFHLVNDRLFNNISIDKSFFLPAVKFGNQNWIVSAFRDTTGLNLYSGYTKVTELQYKVRRPQTKDTWVNITGPARCLAEDSRVCLFPIPSSVSTPMEVLTYEKLRERGIDNLTLFKSGTFSKASADITGRCSLSLDVGDTHLYIRNSGRSSSELKAEVGDFVLSKEGCFVGIVVKVGSTDLGQASTALCYVFTGEPKIAESLKLDLNSVSNQSYTEFVNNHETLRKLAEQLDKAK